MANAIASMAALSLETSLAGTRLLSSSSRAAVSAGKPGVVAVRAHQGEDVPSQSRRSLLSLVAASLASAVVVRESRAASSIKVEGPPPPSGGLRKWQCVPPAACTLCYYPWFLQFRSEGWNVPFVLWNVCSVSSFLCRLPNSLSRVVRSRDETPNFLL